jgi:DNA-binding transcriptional LysR family regulator
MPYGIQQPAISGQISQLEKTLGLKLFHRRPFGLTAAGLRLFDEIEGFFTALIDLPAYVRGHARQQLRLAAPARILRDYLPEILLAYKRRFPNFKLTLFDANQTIAEELLRKGEIDLAITELGGRPGVSIQCYRLIQLPLILLIPKRAPFKDLAAIIDLDPDFPSLISLPPDEVITRHFQAGLGKMKLGWSPAIELGSLELIETYVSLGLGVGVSIATPGRRIQKGLRVLPLPKFSRLTIVALWVGELPSLADSFLADLRKMAARMNQ